VLKLSVSILIVFKNISTLDTPARCPEHLFWLDVACDLITTKKLKKKRLNLTPSPLPALFAIRVQPLVRSLTFR
jgi:hypothetical protein